MVEFLPTAGRSIGYESAVWRAHLTRGRRERHRHAARDVQVWL